MIGRHRTIAVSLASVGYEDYLVTRFLGPLEVRIEHPGRLLPHVVHLAVAGEFLHDRQGLDRLGHPQIGGGAEGLEPHPRALVGGGAADQVKAVGHAIHDRREHPHAGHPRPWIFGCENRFEQLRLDLIEVPERPEGLNLMVLERSVISILFREPRLHRGHHLCLRPAGEFQSGATAYAVGGIGQQRHEFGHGPARDRRRFHERLAIHHHAIDTTVGPVAAGIAEVVLHVADDRILPVGEIECPIGPNLQVGRSEVRIT